MMTRGEVEVDSVWMHEWDLVHPIGHESPYVQIKVSCYRRNYENVEDEWTNAEEGEEGKDFFDDSLRLDDCCVVGLQHCVVGLHHCVGVRRQQIPIPIISAVTGVIDILMHPVYAVPSPYLRPWDQRGNLLQIDEVHEIIHGNRIDCEVTTSSPATNDNRDASVRALMMDMHPILDITCYTLHICKLRDIMEMMTDCGDDPLDMMIIGAADKEAALIRGEVRSSSLHHYRRLKLYCLNWLSLIGPSIGFTMRPVQYDAAVRTAS